MLRVTKQKSIQEAPVQLQHTKQEGREEEEDKHRQEAGVDEGGPGVGHIPVRLQALDRSMSDDREEEAGQEVEEEMVEGNPQGAAEDTEELGLIWHGGVSQNLRRKRWRKD